MANQFDTSNVPETEPRVIVAGDRVQWKRTDLGTDYPNNAYNLKYSSRLEASGSTTFDIASADSDNDFLMTVTSSASDNYTIGTYHWQLYVFRESDSERITLDAGTWEVKPNLDANTSDPRSHAKIVLDAIESVIEGRASKDQESYSIAGRSLSRTPVTDLLELRNYYRAIVVREGRREKARNGDPTGRLIQVQF
tara:strand:- start:1484 stop:2068 length:585 start_codon:yes stop_codon:yes gene_type:complete